MTIAPAKRVAPVSSPEPAPRPRTRRGVIYACAAVVLVVIGFLIPSVVTDTYSQTILVNGVILGLVALGVAFLVNQLGKFSFGVGASYATGAYAFGVAINTWHWGMTAAALFALVVSIVLAVLVGALIVRLDGLPFAMLTLAISVMLSQVVQLNSLRPYLGGSSGLVVSPDGKFAGMTTDQLADPKQFWPIVWVVTSLCVVAVWWMSRSRFGRTLRGIRENEQRMRYSGFNTYWPRIAAFTISSAIAGIAGILHILFQGFATTDMLGFQFSGNAIVSALVGGVGSSFGPVLGGLFYIWGQSKLSTSGNLELYTGIAVAIVIVFFPRGVTGLIGENVRKLRAARAGRKEKTDA